MDVQEKPKACYPDVLTAEYYSQSISDEILLISERGPPSQQVQCSTWQKLEVISSIAHAVFVRTAHCGSVAR